MFGRGTVMATREVNGVAGSTRKGRFSLGGVGEAWEKEGVVVRCGSGEVRGDADFTRNGNDDIVSRSNGNNGGAGSVSSNHPQLPQQEQARHEAEGHTPVRTLAMLAMRAAVERDGCSPMPSSPLGTEAEQHRGDHKLGGGSLLPGGHSLHPYRQDCSHSRGSSGGSSGGSTPHKATRKKVFMRSRESHTSSPLHTPGRTDWAYGGDEGYGGPRSSQAELLSLHSTTSTSSRWVEVYSMSLMRVYVSCVCVCVGSCVLRAL